MRKNVISLFDGMGIGLLSLINAGFRGFRYIRVEIDDKANAAFGAWFTDDKLKEWDVEVVSYRDVKDFPQPDDRVVSEIKDAGVWLLLGGSPCFTEDAMVLTASGIKRIAEVTTEDSVLTHTGRWCKVSKVGGKLADTIIVDAYGMPKVTTTSNHPFLVRTRTKKWVNSIRTYRYEYSDKQWKDAGSLTKDDYLVIPIIKEEENVYDLTDDECFILGRYIADGHTRKDFRKEVGRSENSRHWQLILSIGRGKEFDTPVKHSLYNHSQSTKRMVFSSKRLVEIAEKECGCGAANKHISATLLKLPKDKLNILLEGYLSGDGSRSGRRVRMSTISKALAVSLQLAFVKARGIALCSKEHAQPEYGYIEGRKVKYAPYIYELYHVSDPARVRYKVFEDHVLVPVLAVTESTPAVVYNMQVEEDHSYTVNGVCVHNCTDLSFAGLQRGLDAGTRSSLFFDYVRIKEEFNPEFFLLENTPMKQEFQDIISHQLGVKPTLIDSADFSAQSRKRLYWTNVDFCKSWSKSILTTEDILEDEVADKYYVDPKRAVQICDNECKKHKIAYIGDDRSANRIYNIHGKSVTLIANGGGGGAKTGLYAIPCLSPDRVEKRQNGRRFKPPQSKFYTLTTIDRHGVLQGNYIRKLTPVECERLQGWPEGMTAGAGSDSQRYKICGNGWTEPVIRHILGGLSSESDKFLQESLF